MKAPDKIYVREYPDGLNQFWERKKRDDVIATIPHEYIRKDALLEWAKEKQWQMKIEAGGCSNMLAAGKLLAYEAIIKKIESL